MLIDSRVKLLLLLASCVFVMSTTQLVPNLLIGTFLLLLLILSNEIKFALCMFIPFAFSLIASHYFIGDIQGVFKALFLILCLFIRLVIPIVMSFRLVFKTTTISQFMAAFQSIHIPAVISIPFAVLFRFIPTVQEEWNAIRKAMVFRGIKVSFLGIIKHPLMSVEHILVPMIFSATSIMDELAAASLARGLDSEHERTCAVEVKMKWFDWLFLIITSVFLIIGIKSLVGGLV